ncbi:MAG: hypothetical protein J6B89_01285 [Bacilli bacterium]|nr:hypothetical protein [Bacilli bacterium]
MKKVVEYLLALALFFLVFQFIVNIFIKEYKYKYVIKKENKTYQITEEFQYKNKKSFYNFKIEENNKTYHYFLSHNYHKKKQVIKDLEVYNNNEFNCIFPIFKDDKYSNIICSDNNNIYGYAYLKQINDPRLNDFEKKLKEKGYNTILWESESEQKIIDSYKTNLTYYNNFTKNYSFLIWKYNGVYFINNKEAGSKDILGDNDIYEIEKHAISVKENYLVMDIDENISDFTKIYIIKIKDGSQDYIDLDERISKNSYFNGVYDDTAYITDPDAKKQYKVNVRKKKLEQIAQEDEKGKYYNGKHIEDKAMDELSSTNVYFKNSIINSTITKKHNVTDIKQSNGHYYFKTNNGNIYFKPSEKSNYEILLFTMPTFKEWTVIDDDIFGISNDTLYGYSNEYGLKPLIRYSEFLYHTKNMYSVIKNTK